MAVLAPCVFCAELFAKSRLAVSCCECIRDGKRRPPKPPQGPAGCEFPRAQRLNQHRTVVVRSLGLDQGVSVWHFYTRVVILPGSGDASHMADAEHPFVRRSKIWPKNTSDAVLVMNPDYANA